MRIAVKLVPEAEFTLLKQIINMGEGGVAVRETRASADRDVGAMDGDRQR